MINMSISIKRNSIEDPITGKIIYDEAGILEAIRKKEKILNDGAEDEVRKIIDQVNEKAIKQTPEEKLKILFKILTGSEYTYDTNFNVNPNLTVTRLKPYGYKHFQTTVPFKDWRCLLLAKRGVCEEFALTFENLCVRLGIPCIMVKGMTTIGHAWNAVLINGEVRFIDTSFTKIDRMVREGKEPIDKYFLKDYETSKRWGRSYNDSLYTIKRKLVDLQKNMLDAEVSAKVIIEQVNKMAQTPEEKLKFLFWSLTGGSAYSPYTYDPNFAINSVPQDWRSLLLFWKGTDKDFSLTFENLCIRLGVPCIKVEETKKAGHVWNAVLINGEVRFIDTSFTKIDRMVREGKEPVEKYFLKDYETFKQWGINCVDSLYIIKKRLVELQQSMFGMKSDKISGIRFLNEDDIKKYGSNATGDDDIKKRRR